MKKTIFLFILFLLPAILFCQNSEFKTWRVNTLASIKFNTHKSDFALDKSTSQLSAGLQLGHRFTEKFEMEIGIGFSKRYDYIPFEPCIICDFIGGNIIGDLLIFTPNFELNYLDVSVIGNYYFKQSNRLDLFASAGLNYSLLRAKKLKERTNEIIKYPTVLTNPVVGLGLVFRLSELVELRYQSNYLLGISKATKTDDTNKTNTFSTSLGFGFHF